jgi:signal transduction histidine kinase/CheY-like chemotaxis protein/HPt (histidine-containing phosphotransfer) domain-containing protein
MREATRRTPLLTARWLALGAAGGAAVALALAQIGLDGPWQIAALTLVLLAVFALLATLLALRQRESLLRETTDIAERGALEVDLLQREIERRSHLQQELTVAKQAAEAAVLAKGEFLATMSHEIRTPLNGIVPMLDLLMSQRLAPDQREMVRTAMTSSQQLLRIVDDILDYSKLEANKLQLEITGFNLRELLDDVMQVMARPAEAKGLRLHLHVDPLVRLPVRGDPVRLRQVLTNLVGNAIKFTERGSITVQVERSRETITQHVLRFEVRDTGIGISEAAQERLFSAFTQADASTTRIYGGTGLGLAICRRIVELMGGDIGVQSQPGRGSSFWFEAPLLKVHGDLPSSRGANEHARLLLLTTDAALRARLAMLLPNWGWRVTTAESTQEALERLRTTHDQGAPWSFSVLLADVDSIPTTALALHRNLTRQSSYGEVRCVYFYGETEVPQELREHAALLPRQAGDADLRAVLATDRGAASVPSAAPAVPSATTQALPAGRVLLVEDNPVNLLVAQRLLGVLGVQCDTAVNGEAALLQLQGGHYQLVLMDCQMPVLDGYEAARRWRQHEDATHGGHLPIVAMTANAMAGDRQKCIDAGMDDYLSKPVTRGDLENCLRRWLRAEHDVRPVADAAAVAAAPRAPMRRHDDDPRAPVPPVPAPAPAQDPFARARAALDSVVQAQEGPRPHTPAPAPVPVPAAPPVPSVDAAAATATRPVLDVQILDELRAVLGDEADQIVRVFLEDAPRLVARLESAAVTPDYDELHEAAHTLKSSSANVGALALSEQARRIELGARTRSLDRPAVAVALLLADYARARSALLHALDAAPGAATG